MKKSAKAWPHFTIALPWGNVLDFVTALNQCFPLIRTRDRALCNYKYPSSSNFYAMELNTDNCITQLQQLYSEYDCRLVDFPKGTRIWRCDSLCDLAWPQTCRAATMIKFLLEYRKFILFTGPIQEHSGGKQPWRGRGFSHKCLISMGIL